MRGTATQSSVYTDRSYAGSPFVASHAIDGNFDTNVTQTSGACSHTENNPPVWWQVDLLEVYEITKVAITGRVQDGKSHIWNSFISFYATVSIKFWLSFSTTGYLDNFFIDVSNYSDGSSAQQCAYERVRFVPGETRVYTCPCGMFGRYVRVRFAVTVRSYLQLCEVQIQSAGTQNNSHHQLQCQVRIHVMSLMWTIRSCTDNIFYNSIIFENSFRLPKSRKRLSRSWISIHIFQALYLATSQHWIMD